MSEALRRIPFFSGLDDTDLQAVADHVQQRRLAAGEDLFAEGSPGDYAYVIMDGELEILKQSGRRQVLLARRGPGTVIGEMALLQDKPRMASVRAGRTDTLLLAIGKKAFNTLLDAHPQLLRNMLLTALRRMEKTESIVRHSQQMAQLGTLAAGMAHELNNPAGALHSNIRQLRGAFTDLAGAMGELAQLNPDPGLLEAVTQLAASLDSHKEDLDPLQRSEREDVFIDRLETLHIPQPWELAGTLVDAGLEPEALELLVQTGDTPELISTALRCLAARCEVNELLAAMEGGAARITDIVAALKAYSFLDQAPVQRIDIHHSLEQTLLLLGSKLEGIEVVREYAEDLPPIEAHGRDLNQVWTHLINNAADALNGVGCKAGEAPEAGPQQIVIRTRRDEDGVVVEVEDNGPGISAEHQSRIFEPFYTTKPPGQGTGLGLEVSWNIVTNRHGGDLTFTSRPGKTCFSVILPLTGVRESPT